MRILLAHNSLYFPSHGGGDKSNRLLMEALAARGHQVLVVARIENFGPEQEAAFQAQLASRGVVEQRCVDGAVLFERNGVSVHTVTSNPNLRGYFAARIEAVDPDVIITSTDDPAQLLYDAALKASRAHIMYLIRATIAAPFGPHSAFPSAPRTEALRQADAVVGVSESVARYARLWAGLDAVHVPISLLEPGVEFPDCGNFNNEFVVMVNPCAVKGIDIFAGLAEALPHLKFAAVPTWGTSEEDWAKLQRLKNLTILEPVDHIDLLMRRTLVMLVPSTWAEARSRIVLEAMAHGVPVMASKIGGLPEAKMGVPYLLPIRPITRYRAEIDANMVPIAEVPPQDLKPWIGPLERLTSDPAHYAEISRASRRAALEYAAKLTCERFEQRLEEVAKRPVRRHAARASALSSDRKKALELLMRQRQQQSAARDWFTGLEAAAGKLRLFAFPHAGGGSPAQYKAWRDHLPPFVSVVAVRPDTERLKSMEDLIPQLAEAIAPHVKHVFAFFGHSMGAVIAYELAQHLRKTGRPSPLKLYVSGARAPHYRLNHVPGPEPTDEELVVQLRKLEGTPLDERAALDALLPQLRADASLYRRYVYRQCDPQEAPIRAYGGFDDRNVSAEQLDGWRSHTTKEFGMKQFKGGHFYLDAGASQQAFLEDLANDLALVSCMLSETESPGVR